MHRSTPILFFLILLLFFGKSFAQQGIGTNTPNKSAALEVASEKRGLLIPRVALKGTTDVITIPNPANSLLVYNENTSTLGASPQGDPVSPGYYYWVFDEVANTGRWHRLLMDQDEAGIEPWLNQTTNEKAISNTENIYQTGNVAIGKPTGIVNVALDVKGAIRGGEPNTTASVGTNSLAVGNDVRASGENAVAFGNSSTASGDNSISSGGISIASGEFSSAFGANAEATNRASFAAGSIAKATKSASVAIGSKVNATGESAVALGSENTASGNSSTAIGNNVQAIGVSSVALGEKNEARGYASVALGQETTAKNNGSFVAGFGSTAGTGTDEEGNFSVALGYNAQTEGNYAIAVGNNAKAEGIHSISMGNRTYAKGQSSVAFGDNTNAIRDYSLAVGAFNYSSPQAIFEIGTGTDNDNRFNAITVLENGNVGIGKDDGVVVDDKFTPTQKLDVLSGNVRVRDLYTTTSTVDSKTVVVDENGLLHSVSAASQYALPKFFYMPSVFVPVHDTKIEELNLTNALLETSTDYFIYNSVTQEFTVQLHTMYVDQFNGQKTNSVSSEGPDVSNPKPSLPTLGATEIIYHITWYDARVFEDVSVTPAGVLTYKVKANAPVTFGSFMNIVFEVK